ncbi:MAG TPA: YegP family protein [Thermoanaerobaculia bacterium]|nr:YegP family protein [Thermoanaerobaculia bacterium]
MAGSFVIEKGSTGKYRFNLRAGGNYEKILTSEAYETKAGAEGGIESVRRHAKDDARYVRKTSSDGKPYFVLTATNGQVIGTSEMYSSTSAMEGGIASVKENAPDATVIDRT